jgi:hypothetical protein
MSPVRAVPTGFEPATSALTGPLIPVRLGMTYLHDPWERVKKAQLSARLGTALRACYHTVSTALPRCLRTRNAAAVLPGHAAPAKPSSGASRTSTWPARRYLLRTSEVTVPRSPGDARRSAAGLTG